MNTTGRRLATAADLAGVPMLAQVGAISIPPGPSSSLTPPSSPLLPNAEGILDDRTAEL
jgi:hypothetical protein